MLKIKNLLDSNWDYLCYPYILSIAFLTPLVFSNDTIRVRLFKTTYFITSVFIALLIFLFCSNQKIKIIKLYYGLTLYIFISIISAVISPYYPYSFDEVLNTLAFSIFMIMIINLTISVDKFLIDLGVIVFITLSFAILEKFGFNPLNLPSFEPGRISGTLINPNFFADFLSGIIPLFLFMSLLHNNIKKSVYFFLVSISSIVCLLLSKSRTGVIAVGVSIVFYILIGLVLSSFKVNPFSRKKFITGIIILFVVIDSLHFTNLTKTLIKRFETALSFQENEPFMQRISIWESATNICRDYFWFGSGPGTFKLYYPMYKLPLMWKISSPLFAEKAHQQYLEFISEKGLAGLLSFTLFFIVFFIECSKLFYSNINKRPIVFSSLTAITALSISGLASTVGQTEPPRMVFAILLALPFVNTYPKHSLKKTNIGVGIAPILTLIVLIAILATSKYFYADVYGYKASKNRLINKQNNNNTLTIKMLKIAKSFNPYKPNFTNDLDEVYGYDNDYKNQIDNFDSAFKCYFTFPLYLLNQANIYLNLNQFDMAEKLYKKSIRINCFYPNPYFMLGSTYLRLKKYKEALKPSLHYISLQGDNTLIYKMIADIYMLNEDYENVVKWITYSRTHNAWFPDFSFSNVYAYYKLNRKNLAYSVLKQELNFFPQDQRLKDIEIALKKELNIQ
ncbi:MAG: O-antigen ligase family protein [Candidatus Hydrogenedentota bacterium]